MHSYLEQSTVFNVCVLVLADQPGEEVATPGAEQLCNERVYPSKPEPNF